MAYAVRYRKRARLALNNCCGIYGGSLSGPLHRWLAQLVAEADVRRFTISLDAKAYLEAIIDNPDPEKWIAAGHRWLDASAVAKIKAIGVILTKRCPPWEFRMSVRTFRFLGACTYEALAFYEINHVDKLVIFSVLDLPGPLGHK